MVSKCQVHPIPHGGNFDLFHEYPEVLWKDRKRTVQSCFPPFRTVRWLGKSAHISRFTWHCTWAPQCCGAEWHRQVCIGNGFFDDTGGFFDRCRMGGAKQHPLKSPATKSTCSTGIAARIVRSSFFPIPRFLASWLSMCNDIIVKNDLPLCAGRNDALAMTPCSTHPDSPFTSCCWSSLEIQK